jgi:hypothetical protein
VVLNLVGIGKLVGGEVAEVAEAEVGTVGCLATTDVVEDEVADHLVTKIASMLLSKMKPSCPWKTKCKSWYFNVFLSNLLTRIVVT